MPHLSEPSTSREARQRHYAEFYGSRMPPGGAIVVGNCQAESLRICLDGPDLATMRIPPVHELTADDLPLLHHALRRASVVVAQPIRDDYRELPLGTSQLATHLSPGARLAVVPAVRHRSLHPWQVVVRIAGRDVPDPPIVAYHDLRVMAAALGLPALRSNRDAVLAVAESSTHELRAREERHGAVRISDLFARPSFTLMRTMNHPGNPVWAELARRVRRSVGLAERATDPGRELLSAVVAPREAVVAEAWGLHEDADAVWHVDGATVPAQVVADEHRRWYDAHPELLALAAHRHRDALAELAA